jgi:hypothetical protein
MSKYFLVDLVDQDTWQVVFYEDQECVGQSLFGSLEEANIAGSAYLNNYDGFLPWDE